MNSYSPYAALNQMSLRELEELLSVQRQRGKTGHWLYDVNLHLELARRVRLAK